MNDGLLLRGDAVRDLARSFAETASRHDRDGSFPHENFAALHGAGLLGLTVPREWGGEGAGLGRAAEVVGTVAEGCPATALVLAMQLIHHRALAVNTRIPLALRERLGRGAAEWGRPDPEQAAWNTLLISALYTGVARAARDWLVGFLRDRRPANLGAPLATLPRMEEAVGRIQALLLTNERLVAGAARDGDATPVEHGLVKTVAAENAIAAVQDAVALCGNHGLSRANPLERHLRDVLCARIHTPQPDSAFLAAGRAALHQS